MSKHNKINSDHYHQAGRLAPDDWAREQMKQQPHVPQHQPLDTSHDRDQSTPATEEEHGGRD